MVKSKAIRTPPTQTPKGNKIDELRGGLELVDSA